LFSGPALLIVVVEFLTTGGEGFPKNRFLKSSRTVLSVIPVRELPDKVVSPLLEFDGAVDCA
jgi:hypothetical protein